MKQAMYMVSDSGGIEENNHCWFKKMFLPATSHLRETEAVILFLMGISRLTTRANRDYSTTLLCE